MSSQAIQHGRNESSRFYRADAESWNIPLSFIGVVLALFSLFAINTWELIGSVVLGLFIARAILRVQVMPIMLIWLFPYFEIVTSVIDAETQGLTISERFYGTGQEAFWFSLLGLASLILGWQLLTRQKTEVYASQFIDALLALPLRGLIILHVIVLLLTQLVDFVVPYGSSISQLTVHLNKAPLMVLYLIFLHYRFSREMGWTIFLLFGYNIAVSFASFFSEWREFLFLFAFASLVQVRPPDVKVIRRLGILTLFGLVVITTWQAVKGDYRKFLNGDTESQRVVVGRGEALSFFINASADYWFTENFEDYETVGNKDVGQATLERLGYLDFFARMMQYVPEEIPHENGQLLKGNLSFALIPRILNPNKGVKDDQWKVEKYTKRVISDHSSFSLGHFAEHFVDFGGLGMLISLFCFGAVGGWMASLFMRSSGVTFGLDMIALFLIGSLFVSYQADAIKIYGQTFWGVLVYFLVTRKLLTHFLGRL